MVLIIHLRPAHNKVGFSAATSLLFVIKGDIENILSEQILHKMCARNYLYQKKMKNVLNKIHTGSNFRKL